MHKHERVALQFSGGKDSLAILHIMKPYWDKITVYWLNTGDAPTETLKQMDGIRNLVPNFVEVAGCTKQSIEEFGWPSDVVPVRFTKQAKILANDTAPFLVQDRYDCCTRSMMLPMYERMIQDQITMIIRGQRLDEVPRSPVRSGDVIGGVEYYFPLENWTEQEVFNYLKAYDIELPKYYQYSHGAVDCIHCTAYLDHHAGRYLSNHEPIAYNERTRRLNLIKDAVQTAFKE